MFHVFLASAMIWPILAVEAEEGEPLWNMGGTDKLARAVRQAVRNQGKALYWYAVFILSHSLALL